MRHVMPLLLLLSLPVAAPVAATTVYRCIGADGVVAYQDQPCAAGQKASTIVLPDSAPSAPVPPPPSMPTAASAPPPPAAPPPAPLPQLYACYRATDGKRYVSSDGNPPSYLAPIGVLGAISMPLARTYGPGGAGISAPGVGPTPHVASRIAGYYTSVQDRCEPLPRAEICQRVQQQYDAVEHKLRNAFQDAKPALEAEASHLRSQLRGCQ